MPNYPYSFQLPPLSTQDIPNDGAVGEFLGISAGGVLDWLPVSSASGDMLKSENLSGLASYPTARTNLGLGTADTPTFKNLVISTGSIATSAPVTISQTWNDAAVTFKALVVNATTPGSTSAAGSLLLDLQVGGVSKFSVNKVGESNAYSYIGLNSSGGGTMQVSSGNGSYGYHMARDYCVTWGGGATLNGTIEVSLCRDGAANTLALRNSTAAQTFNVYGTYTSGTSYERLTLSAPSSANAIIGTNKGSSGGTARGLEFQTDGLTRLSISGSGPFLATFGSAYNALWLELSANSGTLLQYNSTHKIYFSSSVCEITATNTTITTGLVRFSGNTSSFPALKRSTTYLQARLADDSAFAPIQGKLTTDTAFTSGAITDTGYIVLYDSTGAAYKVACTPV